jgi:ComF family protein
MPFARYTADPENPVARIFWGRVKLEHVTSLLRFEKGSRYQVLIHQLKYKGKKAVGTFLGKLVGAEIMDSVFSSADFLVPVPLHPKKELERGYNQSQVIAEGLSSVTGIPIASELLHRKTYTESQTQRNRFERWENMEFVFDLSDNAEDFEGCSFVLVDDVLTTGSTLEACSRMLLSIPGSRVYAVTVACA